MSNDTTEAPTTPVLDSKGQTLELRMRVTLKGERDKDEAGKPRLGTIVALRVTRQQVVVQVDGVEKLVVRRADSVMIKKNRSGKILRVEAPARKRPEVLGHCEDCGRPLGDPVSVARGRGSVCAGKAEHADADEQELVDA